LIFLCIALLPFKRFTSLRLRLVPSLAKGSEDKLSVPSVLDPSGLKRVVGQEVELAWAAVVFVSASRQRILVYKAMVGLIM
jgi:hypothetical protein